MAKCQHDYDPDGNYCVQCDFAPTRAVMASELQKRIKALEELLRRGIEYLADENTQIQTRGIGTELAIMQWLDGVKEALTQED